MWRLCHYRTVVRFVLLFITAAAYCLIIAQSSWADIADLEKDLQASLEQSGKQVSLAARKLEAGLDASAEIARIRALSENIRVTHLLLEERFRLREEKVKTLGSLALTRQQTMAEGYRRALTEYLSIIDGLPSDGSIPQSAIRMLQSLLDKLIPIFGYIIKESGAKYLLQGTILTDVDETIAGIKRQHNVFEQLGIDPEEAFGYRIIEPLIQLRKDGVRIIGKALGLPAEIFERIPFPGPALAARVIGEVTPERIETVRKATAVVEELLKDTGAFQYMAILHEDRVTGMRDGKRDFGQQIEVRCWDSIDARTATPTRLSFEVLEKVAGEIIRSVPSIVSVTYNIAPKPPSTIEVV